MRECSVCRLEVRYGTGRRKCRICRSWCHEACSIDTDKTPPAICTRCLRRDDRGFFMEVAVDLNGSPGQDSKKGDVDDLRPVVYVLWCMFFGREASLEAEKFGIPPEDIDMFERRLEQNGCWSEDGRIVVGEGGLDDVPQFSVAALLVSLVASGHVTRTVPGDGPVDAPAASVAADGGNER